MECNCKRCGRLLKSKKSLKIGYGPGCYKHVIKEEEEKKPIPGQINIFEVEEYS